SDLNQVFEEHAVHAEDVDVPEACPLDDVGLLSVLEAVRDDDVAVQRLNAKGRIPARDGGIHELCGSAHGGEIAIEDVYPSIGHVGGEQLRACRGAGDGETLEHRSCGR